MRFPPIITPPRRVIGSLKESLQGYYFLLYDLPIYIGRFENRCCHYKIEPPLCQALIPLFFYETQEVKPKAQSDWRDFIKGGAQCPRNGRLCI